MHMHTHYLLLLTAERENSIRINTLKKISMQAVNF